MLKLIHFYERLQDPTRSVTFTSVDLVRLNIVKGSDLVAKDRRLLREDTSDPYVVFKQGKLEKKSEIVKKSLDPVWDMLCEFTVPSVAATVEDEEQDALFEVSTYVKRALILFCVTWKLLRTLSFPRDLRDFLGRVVSCRSQDNLKS